MRSLICLLISFLFSFSVQAKDLIPLQDFFKNPVAAAFILSPSGKQVAYLKPWEGRLNIFVRSADSSGEEKRLSSVEDRDIANFFWKGDANIFYLKDFGGDENFHLFGINVVTGTEKDLTPFEKTRVEIVDDQQMLNDTEVLISHNHRDAKVFDVYRLNVKDGSLKLVYQNPGDIAGGYLADLKGKLRIALQSVGTDTQVLVRDSESAKFQPLLKFDYNDSFSPILFSADGKSIYALSNLGRDKIALVEFDLKSKKETRILYEATDYDLDSASWPQLIYSYKHHKLLGVNFLTWKMEQAFFDPEMEAIFNRVEKETPGAALIPLSQNKDETKFTFLSMSDKVRAKFYLYDTSTQKLQLLGEAAPWLNADDLANMRPIEFTSRDGMVLHGYLTIPKNADEKNLPTVINPHGGPWARDSWRFNAEAQFLASRGYAVLQVNYRGSTGYGKEFFKASFKQWGLKMQDDLTDGTRWLIQQGIANPKKICIYGGSYGGYATLMGLVKEPDLYTCGVDYVGVANLFTFMKTIPPYWTTMLDKLHVWVGDTEKDKDQFIATSPALHVDRIKAPLFIAQGAKDPRVNKDESDQMVKNLKARGVEVPYLVKDNEGHGFRNEENRIEFYQKMESFLKEHLQ